MIERLQLRGELALEILRGGKVVERWRSPNLIVNGGYERMAHLLAGDGDIVSQIGVGEGSDAPEPTDTVLTNGFAKALASSSFPAAGRVQFTFSIGTTEANGLDITEFGLLCADDTLFARRTRSVIHKDSDMTINGTWTVFMLAGE